MTTAWTRAHVAAIDTAGAATAVFDEEETKPAIPYLHLWDLWPVRTVDGDVPDFGGRQFWMALSAARQLQPSVRHDVAAIRLLSFDGTVWADHGRVFDDAATPGSREWAGSAVFDPRDGRVRVRYTASGWLGETRPTFAQRMFEADAAFDPDGASLTEWSSHRELVSQEGGTYRSTLDQITGAAGFIKAFRDPFVFVDPADQLQHLLFTASLAQPSTDFDAAVGHAIREPGSTGAWEIQEPLLTADGVNNEMERPHIVERDGLYYLFFSTQRRTFHPDVQGPTGLYGFGSDSLDGEWTPLNGHGLVLCNPLEEPYQAYSWLVLDDLRVTSFVDMHSLGGHHPDDVEAAGNMPDHFGGTAAPFEQIQIEGDRAWVVRERS